MEKTKIDWCNSTWNVITGCWNDCRYCYARSITKRFGGSSLNIIHSLHEPFVANGRIRPYPFGFTPTFHHYRLDDYKNKHGRSIFVCSMGDMFGEWIPDDWIKKVFESCRNAPQHTYLFLTKYPHRYIKIAEKGWLPEERNMWFGASAADAEMFSENAKKLADLKRLAQVHTFISAEPLLDDIAKSRMFAFSGEHKITDWIIAGAETGNRAGKTIPQFSWLKNLDAACTAYDIPLFLKSSLDELWTSNSQEAPKKELAYQMQAADEKIQKN